jgi:hypothetical protein
MRRCSLVGKPSASAVGSLSLLLLLLLLQLGIMVPSGEGIDLTSQICMYVYEAQSVV